MTFFLWMMLLIEIGSEVGRLFFNFNVPVLHIYTYSQSAILGVFYLKVCHNPKQRKFIRWYIVLMTLTLVLLYTFKPGAFMRFNLFEIIITNYLLVVASLFYLYNIISGTGSFLYLSLGVLVCAILDISVFLFADFLVTLQKEEMMIMWVLHEFGVMFLHLMITVQWFNFFVYRRKNKDE